MVNKKCIRCERVLAISEFYVHSQIADGHLNICKDCTKKRIQGYRQENIEQVREYDRKRGRTEEHNKMNRACSRSLKEKNPNEYKRQITKASQKYKRAHPDKRHTYSVVWNKLNSKKLIRKPCEVCATILKVEAHHDDYSRPLEIRWLCKKHHMELHRTINDARRASKKIGQGEKL